MVAYPVLAGEIAKRGLKKKAIADSIGICDRALRNKLSGKVAFTWPEVSEITTRFFPDMAPEVLFRRTDDSGT